MQRTTCLIATLLVLTILGSANDGAYLTRGGVIYPMKETRISMAREFLSFTCAGEVATVQVLFEFYNPDSLARKLLVGFQAPTSVGDVSDSLIKASHIRDLKVMVDGSLLPITLKVAECEDCPLRAPSEIEFHQDNPGIYVYLFEVTFQPGITRVQHSYDFTASSNVVFDRMFNYILTTGSKWAGSTIRDLTVEIDMGHNQYFYVTDVFGKEAEWSIIGTGAVTSHTFDYHHGITCRMVRTLAGKLRIHASDLVPQHNFEFGLCSAHSFFGVPLNETGGLSSKVFLALRWSTLDMTGFDLEPLTIDELRALRNCIYAMHGYAFRDEELRSYYERFPWYVADPNMTNIASELSPKEQRLIAQIVALERSAK